MDSTPQSPEPVSATTKRRPHRTLRLAIVLGIPLLIAVLLLAVLLSPGPKVVWLNPSELSHPARSTLLARFKYRVAVLVWPLVHNFWHGKPFVEIKADVLTFSATAARQTGLGSPFATNADGLRIWIISQNELSAFQKRLTNLPGAMTISRSRIQTKDGMQANVQEGGPVVSGAQSSRSTNWSMLKHYSVNLTPKITSTSINLTIGVAATEETVSQSRASFVKTNLAAVCRVLVPNMGALIMDGGNARDSSGNIYWLIASPTAVDRQGNPVKF